MGLDQDLTGFVQRVFACPAETATAIARRASERVYAAQAVILRAGDRPTDTWLVMAGRAQALVYGAEGQLVMLQEYAGGDLFGAIANLDAGPQPAEIKAVETVRAALFLAGDFLALIETHTAVGLAVSRLLLRQLRETTGRMADRITLSAPDRVRAELLRMAVDAEGRLAIDPFTGVTALAIKLSIARETVSRAINALERRGVVRREGRALVIVSPRLLRGDFA